MILSGDGLEATMDIACFLASYASEKRDTVTSPSWVVVVHERPDRRSTENATLKCDPVDSIVGSEMQRTLFRRLGELLII